MVVFDEEKIELLISQCRFAEAVAALYVSPSENARDEEGRRRFLCSV